MEQIDQFANNQKQIVDENLNCYDKEVEEALISKKIAIGSNNNKNLNK